MPPLIIWRASKIMGEVVKRYVDLESWERRDTFNFFKDFVNPNISVTSRIDCTGVKEGVKSKGYSFFLCYLYSILGAVNDLEAFHYRVDKEGRVVCYDTIDAIVPVRIDDKGGYQSVIVEWDDDFERFAKSAVEKMSTVAEGEDSFSAENNSTETNCVTVSAVPDLYFTCVTHTLNTVHAYGGFPLINVGKLTREGETEYMPISISVHHGLIDGWHIQKFLEKIEMRLHYFNKV